MIQQWEIDNAVYQLITDKDANPTQLIDDLFDSEIRICNKCGSENVEFDEIESGAEWCHSCSEWTGNYKDGEGNG